MATAALLALAVLLEVVQWWRGGYATPEYIDMASNVIGALMGRLFFATAPGNQVSRSED